MHAIQRPQAAPIPAVHAAEAALPHVSAPVLSPPASPSPRSPSRAERSLRSVLERERRRPPTPAPPPPPPPSSRCTSPARSAKPLPWAGDDECDLVALVERSIALQASPRAAPPLASSLDSLFASDVDDDIAPPLRRPRFSTSPRSGYDSDSGVPSGRREVSGAAGMRLAAALAAASSTTLPLPMAVPPRAASHTSSASVSRVVPRSARARASASATTPSPPSAFAFAPVIARIQSLSVIKRGGSGRGGRNPNMYPADTNAQPPAPFTSTSAPTPPPRLPFVPSSPRVARIKDATGARPPSSSSTSPAPTSLPTPPQTHPAMMLPPASPFRPGSPLPLPSPRPDPPPPRPPSAPPRRPPRWRADSAPPKFLPSPPPTPPEDDEDALAPLLVPPVGHAAPFDVEIAARRLARLPGRICFDDVALPPPDDADDEAQQAGGPHPRMGRRWSLW